jgi:hypothetical protein
MNALAAEYQEVFQLYLRLSQEFAKILDAKDTQNPNAQVESILRNRDSLAQIEQLNSRVLQLSYACKKCSADLDPKSQEEIQNMAQTAKAQAIRLRELCSIHAQKIQATRDGLSNRLTEIRKGAQCLQSIKPIKYNYPKFIDSTY